MVDEDAFQKALDANIDSHDTRLVFADWLEEQDDARAAGMRWLGSHQMRPDDSFVAYSWHGGCDDKDSTNCVSRPSAIKHLGIFPGTSFWHFDTRREAEDAFCLEFGKRGAK
jgi:uncharacterized protein (TIGR02996 family)